MATADYCYVGRNVIATNGIIYNAELTCIETPAGGDPDVNVVENTSGTIAGDEAAGAAYLTGNSGDLAAGKTIQLLTTNPTADYYYYLATTEVTNVAYTAGQIMIRTWGHPVLTVA